MPLRADGKVLKTARLAIPQGHTIETPWNNLQLAILSVCAWDLLEYPVSSGGPVSNAEELEIEEKANMAAAKSEFLRTFVTHTTVQTLYFRSNAVSLKRSDTT